MDNMKRNDVRVAGALSLIVGAFLAGVGTLGALLCILALAFSFGVPPATALVQGIVCAIVAIVGWRAVDRARLK
jgi:hypothetical protein